MNPQASRHQVTVPTDTLMRIVIGLIAVWDALAGLALIAFHGATSGALGAGVEDEAGKRLLGVHLLILVPIYLLLALRLERYMALLWLPIAAQASVVLVIGYNMLKGDTKVGDGILAFAVSLIFVALLGFLWVTERRTTARLQMEEQDRAAEAGPLPSPPSGARGPDIPRS